jgi:N,N'-diacetylchitobiose transport system substrate-binding protein
MSQVAGSLSVRARGLAADRNEDQVKIKKLAALGLAGSLLMAACGSDDDDDDASATDDETSEAAAFEAPPADTEATLRVWLNGPDTPQEMRDLAIEMFNEKYPNVTVEIEEQEWDGLVDRLNNVLNTDDTPDIVEMGNTQAQTYEAGGALVDLTSVRDDLGGDDLLDSLAESGTYEGQFYGLPLYAGARVVTYRTDLFEASGIEIPTTLDEFVEAGKKLQADNADTPNFSGIYFPGRNWQAMLSFIWDSGGEIATQADDGSWTGELDSDESVAGLELVQDIMENANQAPADSDDRNDFTEFCNGEIGMLMGPGWKMGQILGEDGCPDVMTGKVSAFPLPGSETDVAPSFLGGSNLGISANSSNVPLAVEFLKIIASDEFQTQYGANGLIPARKSLLDTVEGDEGAQAQAKAAEITRAVPSSEFWAEVEGQDILQGMGTAIASGDDVAEAAGTADAAIEEILNQ